MQRKWTFYNHSIHIHTSNDYKKNSTAVEAIVAFWNAKNIIWSRSAIDYFAILYLSPWIRSHYVGLLVKGPPFNIQGGGGAEVLVAGKLFISTRLGGELKISNFITCL